MHSLLQRQLRHAGFCAEKLPEDTTDWQAFLARVELSYLNADRERERLEKQNGKTPQNQTMAQACDTFPEIHSLLDSLGIAVCMFDKQERLLLINRMACDYINIDQKQPLSMHNLLDKFQYHSSEETDSEKISATNLISRLRMGQSVKDHNAQIQTGDDLPISVSLYLCPLYKQQCLDGFVIVFSDIGEFKTIEQELIHARDTAEHASRAKSHFLSSMSHELRTPMNAILGYGELLKEDIGELNETIDKDHADELLNYVSNILQAGRHLLELINKILDLTRIEAGKLDITVERVELLKLVHECVDLVRPLSEKRKLSLHVPGPETKEQYALVDPARLKQVIINLLSNAVKYNRDNGSVTIRLSQPSVEYIRLEVTDTGIGLTDEEKEKVFDPFTRMSGANLIEGTGIGLTITRKLLQIMDGRIGIRSVKGEGSTFWIELPTGEVVNPDKPTMQHRHYILLYIEDNRSNVSLLAQILKARPDIALLSAHTGEAGLELARIHHPDIILLDINLPGIDGFEVMQHLREDKNTQQIPVVVLSASENTQPSKEGEGNGFLRYIVKPLDIKNFLETIDMALENSTKRKT